MNDMKEKSREKNRIHDGDRPEEEHASGLTADILSDKMIFLDGATGTMLQKSGLKLGERPEILCITNPQIIEDIKRK